ncbi:MAG: hypothetical protein KJ600_01335 [Nanoarchaeota archaeon]|nr:hypothetical protein [Nanoarchaeota archaeon]
MINSKRGYEFSFSWLFAIFIGAVVIFFAIYAASQIVKTKQFEQESIRGKRIGILLTPLETELEQGKFGTLFIPNDDETMLFADCSPPTSSNPFGSQYISTSIKPTFGGEWEPAESQGVQSTFHNKYLFTSHQNITGKEEFYVFSKPFNLPFKIADLTIVWSDQEKYCFDLAGAVPEIREELKELNMTNIFIKGVSVCPEGSINVCFQGSCPIRVHSTPGKGVVEKPSGKNYYIEAIGDDKFALLYAAIFSDPAVYNCQVKRLMAHASELATIYTGKSETISSESPTGCSRPLQDKLRDYKLSAKEIIKDSENPKSIQDENIHSKAQEVENANPPRCRIF